MRTNIKDYTQKRLSTKPPEATDFKVGDKVTFTNEYGVSFENLKVIGYSDDILYQYGKFIHLDTDAYWFPHSPKELS